MFICNCNGITEGQVREAAERGCASLRELSREMAVGTCCGKCVPDARKLLRQCGAAHEQRALHAAAGD